MHCASTHTMRGDNLMEAYAVGTIGLVMFDIGKTEEARLYFEREMELAIKTERSLAGNGQWYLFGSLSLYDGQFPQRCRIAGKSGAFVKRISIQRNTPGTLYHAALLGN